MHEMSLAGGILRLIEQAAEREGFKRVESVQLEVGVLAGVDARALRFALDAMAPGTILEGAALQIDEPPARASCVGCGAVVHIQARSDPCPACGAYRLLPQTGTELRVMGLVVHDD